MIPDLPDCLMSMSHSHDTRVAVEVNHTCSVPEYVTLRAPFQLTAHSAVAPPVRTHVTLPAEAAEPYWRPRAVRAYDVAAVFVSFGRGSGLTTGGGGAPAR